MRRLRQSKGFSLTEFADRVGVSRPTVWSWESGRSQPRPQNRAALALALNLAENALILDEEAELKTQSLLEREIASAKSRIARVAGTAPEYIDITIRW